MNRKLKCIIVDDEPLARDGLRRYIGRVDRLELQGECEDALQLDSMLRAGLETDLIFLDIEMPLLSGIDYLRTVGHHPMVIITSAYSQYALEGYELNVVDYLLKPIPFARFLQAVTKACDFAGLTAHPEKRDFFFVKSDKKFHKIRFADILYLEAVENYVKIVTDSGAVITRCPLRNLVADLPSHGFLQVHKSYIVNMGKVECIEGNMLHLPGTTITVSRSYKDNLMKWL